MKRLRLLILAFGLAVSVPLAFVVWQSLERLRQEEQAQLRFFGETLLDTMEAEMSALVQQEENRAVDEYHHTLAGSGGAPRRSPLAAAPEPAFILGYLQNNPDGSFQTPLVADLGSVPSELRSAVTALKDANRVFNRKKLKVPVRQVRPVTAGTAAAAGRAPKRKSKKQAFAERYVLQRKAPASKGYLGKKKQRTEEVTARQVMNLAREEFPLESKAAAPEPAAPAAPQSTSLASRVQDTAIATAVDREEAEKMMADEVRPPANGRFQVEVAPLQAVAIDQDLLFIFRRVVIRDQIYRQGFLIKAEPFLQHLVQRHFTPQPMAGFSSLRLAVLHDGQSRQVVDSGVPVERGWPVASRIFPAPFDFIDATLIAGSLPVSPARQALRIALVALGLVLLLGLLAIYKNARTVVELSERRAGFVSSVTHELKTPLTNIRMYIEMLQQGIAATPEREQEYLEVLGSESTRLSHLINNVLELSKLEKKQRHFDMITGDLADVLSEVHTVMAPKLTREGFVLVLENRESVCCRYDREVMIQVLINLVENSIKFGRRMAERRITICVSAKGRSVTVAVRDTGPGIPANDLDRVFDDFYRVDNDLTRTTGGTGIGLALVKKFIRAMGGTVKARNRSGGGCVISMVLPVASSPTDA